jgi:hypothetical protein
MTLSLPGCISRPTIEPFCPEGQEFRRDARRVAEFAALLDTANPVLRRNEAGDLVRFSAPATRSWILWVNQTYRYNCKLAGLKP